MDYEEMESELEMAGIDLFEFSLMDEDERREVLEDNCLDPWDFDDFDLEYPGEYSYTPPVVPVTPKPPVITPSPVTSRPSPSASPSVPIKQTPSPGTTRPTIDFSATEPKGNIYSSHRICMVRIPSVSKIDCYIVNGLDLKPGDTVEVPVGATRNPVAATVLSLTYGNAPNNQTVIRKLPDCSPDQRSSYMSPEQIRQQRQRQAEIAKIDRKMKQIRTIIILLASILVVIVLVGLSTTSQSPGIPVPAYTINPTTEVVRLPSPTPRPTATPTQKAIAYPYEGMPESAIYFTALGPPTKIKKDIDFEHYRPIRQFKEYVWEKNGSTYFTATTSYWKDGKEVPGYVSSIWRSKDFKSNNGVSSSPYVGKKLSRYDDELYFLGGGGQINGVSTSKFRYSVGSKTYVVYLDNDYVIRRIEDYLPQSSTKKSSSSTKKSTDPYHAKDYSHPDDFYYDYYDDFWDYEDAEDYWDEYH